MKKNRTKNRLGLQRLDTLVLAAALLGALLTPAAPVFAAQGYYNSDMPPAAAPEKKPLRPPARKPPITKDDTAEHAADENPDVSQDETGDAQTPPDDEAAGAEDQGAALQGLTDSTVSAPQRHVVTSVRKCFDEIGREATLEIRKISLTPYADCQKRLKEKLKKEEGEAKDEKKEVETPRNYVRVREKPILNGEDIPREKPQDKARDKPRGSSRDDLPFSEQTGK